MNEPERERNQTVWPAFGIVLGAGLGVLVSVLTAVDMAWGIIIGAA